MHLKSNKNILVGIFAPIWIVFIPTFAICSNAIWHHHKNNLNGLADAVNHVFYYCIITLFGGKDYLMAKFSEGASILGIQIIIISYIGLIVLSYKFTSDKTKYLVYILLFGISLINSTLAYITGIRPYIL